VRDTIVEGSPNRPGGASVNEITEEVSARIGETPASSVRSYLRLDTPRFYESGAPDIVACEKRRRNGCEATVGLANGSRVFQWYRCHTWDDKTARIVNPFAGAGSTLAAAEAAGYASIGIEQDRRYFDVAREAIPKLRALRV
jgi:hypothetical protein